MDKIGGKYEIIQPLGTGATATVFLCHDPFMDRHVAVKHFNIEMLNDPLRGRLHRRMLSNEASLAGKLVHPHIVQIYDAVIGQDEAYIVMEYVQGTTLRRYCSVDNLLPVECVLELIFKCTNAMAHANRTGITHRDIKPANLLLPMPADGSATMPSDIKISDFGACLQTNGDQSYTQVLGVGSPAYMSPEQLREENLNHQTDIYSLGVVMFQLLTGRLPFQASSKYGLIYQICNCDTPLPSDFRNDLPAELDAIVQHAMHKDLAHRYKSWHEFARDLMQATRQHGLRPLQEPPGSEKFHSLRSLRFFDDFSDVEIWEIVHFARWNKALADTVLMRDGEPGDDVLILLEGVAEVRKSGYPLQRLEPGAVFGEIAVIDRRHARRIADVVSLTDTRYVVIPGSALRQSSSECRMHFYEGFLRLLAERLSLNHALITQTS